MSKHTPTPWRAVPMGGDSVVVAPSHRIHRKYGDLGYPIAVPRMISHSPSGVEFADVAAGFTHDDARLVAEAPAMEADVLRKLVHLQETAVSTTEFGIMASDIADQARAILARIDGNGDASPPTKGPTPEAGYQSLLRETAGQRLGASKGDEE